MLKLEKVNVISQKGKKVYYSIPNLLITEISEGVNVQYDSFIFYTPVGNREDNEGYKYYEVPAINEDFNRYTGDTEIMIAVKIVDDECIIYCVEKAVGSDEPIPFSIDGMEGDIVLSGIIPTDPAKEITIEYKEVQ